MADERHSRGWPGWLLTLRPDRAARDRMRARLEARAGAVLAARRAPSWQEVAARWAGGLAPLAAALVLVCGALAYRAAAPESGVRLATPEELVRPATPEEPPELLTASTEPSADGLLSAIIDGREP